MQAMLLAAGLGTRLKPLTDLSPKPIVPLANRPLASFAMERLAKEGICTIVANTHPKAELVERVLRSVQPEGVDLLFSRESKLLGTGGGLRRARSLFDDQTGPVVVMNGDTLFAPDLAAPLRLHLGQGAIATMILREPRESASQRAVGIDERGWVRTLLGAPRRRVHRELMFTGVHILSPEAFNAMPDVGCVIRSAYRTWVDRGAPVLGFVDQSPWADLGTVSEYHRVNLELVSGSRRWPGLEPVHGCLVADPAVRSMAGASVRRSVVGANVRIAPGVEIEDSVIWEGSTVDRAAFRSVITPEHRIELS